MGKADFRRCRRLPQRRSGMSPYARHLKREYDYPDSARTVLSRDRIRPWPLLSCDRIRPWPLLRPWPYLCNAGITVLN
jgi:hypothetical protein